MPSRFETTYKTSLPDGQAGIQFPLVVAKLLWVEPRPGLAGLPVERVQVAEVHRPPIPGRQMLEETALPHGVPTMRRDLPHIALLPAGTPQPLLSGKWRKLPETTLTLLASSRVLQEGSQARLQMRP